MRDELWMKHDARSRMDPKMSRFVALAGAAGYGLFWAIIEILHYQNDHELTVEDELPAVGESMGLAVEETMRLTGLAHSCRLFKIKDGVLWQEKLKQDQANRSTTKQNAGRLGGLKSGESRRSRTPPPENDNFKVSGNPELNQAQTKQLLQASEATKLEEREEREEREEKRVLEEGADPKKSKQKEIPGFREGCSQYGEYRHVWLQEREYSNLVSEFGTSAVESKIIHLDSQIENGLKNYIAYKNHAACVRNWCASDKAQGKVPLIEPLPKGYTWIDRNTVRGPDGEAHHISFVRNVNNSKFSKAQND